MFKIGDRVKRIKEGEPSNPMKVGDIGTVIGFRGNTGVLLKEFPMIMGSAHLISRLKLVPEDKTIYIENL